VVGNPPYIDSEEMSRSLPEERNFCINADRYRSASGNWDIFCVFIELGIILNKHGGYFGMIVPNKLLAADYASEIQNVIVQNRLLKLRDYSKVKVFGEEANVYPIVVVVNKNKFIFEDSIHIEVMEETLENPEIAFTNRTDVSTFKKLPTGIWSPLIRQNFPILHKILANTLPLSDIAYVRGGATVSEAYEIKNYLEDRCELKDSYAALINTGAIEKYEALWGLHGTLYLKNTYLCPAIKHSNLKKISETRFNETVSEKLIIAGMGLEIENLYDKGEYLAGKSTVIVLSKGKNYNLKFFCAVLNSKLSGFVYRELFESLALQGGYLRIGPPQIERLPIPNILFSPSEHRKRFVNETVKLFDMLKIDEILYLTKQELSLKKNDTIHDILAYLAEKMIEMNKEKQKEIKGFLGWLESQLKIIPAKGIEALTGKTQIKNYIGDYQKGEGHLSFEDFWKILEKNKNKIKANLRSREIYENIKSEYENSLSKLLPLKEKLHKTDWLIDQIVYKLYGLTDEEIQMVENSLKR